MPDNLQGGQETEDNRGNLIGTGETAGPADRSAEALLDHPYSRLKPETIIEAVESAGYRSDAGVLALNSYENRVYQVGIEGAEPLIAKFYRPGRWTRQQIDEEHRFCRYLYEQEIPVVAPMTVNKGSEYPTLGEYGGFLFALYARQGGRAPQLDDLDQLQQLGRFIGRIHLAGKSFPLRFRRQLNTDDFASSCVEYLLREGFIPNELIKAYEAVTAELLEAIEAGDPQSNAYAQIALHGDCHAGNVLWRDDRPHFVDFDDVMRGPAMQDLWMLLSGDRSNRQKQLADIIEGYETFMPFNPAELRLVETLRAMRLLYYNAWLARRWHDPAFPMAFPWFNTPRYWSDHILDCKEQLSNLFEDPLSLC